MDPIHNTYDWLKYMRMKRRWRPGSPTVLAVRGAELVREKPSEIKVAEPPPPAPTPEPPQQAEAPAPEPPPPEEAPRGRRGRHVSE